MASNAGLIKSSSFTSFEIHKTTRKSVKMSSWQTHHMKLKQLEDVINSYASLKDFADALSAKIAQLEYLQNGETRQVTTIDLGTKVFTNRKRKHSDDYHHNQRLRDLQRDVWWK
ncbi:hypothetical protein WALSEDRAFT_33735 [Wallemia mellicola CBS 633.66]|uniref:SPX domain-containing protein n=1 Tax=Wallemia mellicola (strain ATCC MYA-4683 / CBS 633.66) TaxID=671144 RepID=I4Y7J0_WALMC|nr:hypothetical protein WALSEDRAFT_33735 [Wallemia mellicola CBS 633.66]EIM19932.1 hypothetical protein WALSEDRAFT_33735 [Wallemia mellicola CBS 633.66]TIB93420.1 hypothetical protein E3Q18_04470 [Wallemia mellicola]|eukprot:XP_006960071.1 hypothetical protein WALSEDRAFT_33735 [Wallemia mellicola CBS 633.66]